MSQLKNTTNTKSNFGTKGWIIVFYIMLTMFLNTGTTVDGTNITVAEFSAAFGWDPNTLLYFGSVAGVIALIGLAPMGWICNKIGAKNMTVFSAILGGASYIWYANAHSLVSYAISFSAVTLFVNGMVWVGGAAITANWFPRKKGLVMGWTTMGNNFSTAFFVAMITFFIARMGLSAGLSIVGVMMIVLGVIGFFVLKDTPEQAGCWPDNIKPENAGDTPTVEAIEPSTWTLAQLLRTKELYLAALPCGICMLVTIGTVSQLVPRIMSFGYEQPQAIFMMSVCAIIGVVGSYAWGWVDQKFGTQKAISLFCLWFAGALLFNILPGKACLFISIFMIGGALGGNANFPVSITASLFGRRDFIKAYTPINMIVTFMRTMGFAALAFCTQITGTVSGAYVIFIVLLIIGSIIMKFLNVEKFVERHGHQ